MSKYCKFPWTWQNVKMHQNKWRFCCKTKYLPYDEYIETITKVQTDFINHIQPKECDACWNDEINSGGVSYRTTMGGETSHEQIVKFYSKNKQLEWIDIEFGDLCNMYCASCGPNNSTTWQQILKIKIDNNHFDASWDTLQDTLDKNINYLNHINIYGGEPSIDSNFIRLAEYLSQFESTCRIQIYTNGNYSESYKTKFENTLKKLESKGWKIDLHFSLDSVGENVEFMRGGLNFNRFAENLKASVDMGFNTYVNITISLLNVELHYDVYNWLKDNNLHEKVSGKFNSVASPTYLSVSNLGNKISDFLPDTPNGMPNNWNFYNNQIKQLTSKQVSKAEEPNKNILGSFIRYLQRYSELSNTKLPLYYVGLIDKLNKL